MDRVRRTAAVGAAVAAGVLGAAAALGVLSPAARADDAPLASYVALASTSGLIVGLANDSIPAVPQLEISAPTAQASLDTLGNSLAFASAPYPGSAITGLTQILSSVFGAPLPAYPMYTSTDTVGEARDGGAPGLSFHAESQAKTAVADATVGSGPSGGQSRVSVADNTGSGGGLASAADTKFSLAGLGGVFSIDGVSDVARATVDSSGLITTTSDLRFARMIVPGLAIRVPQTTPANVPLANPVPNSPQPPPLKFPPLPLPYGGQVLYAPELAFANGAFTVTLPTQGNQRYAVPTDAVLAGLKQAGITATYQQATDILEGKRKVGIIGAGLTFATTLPAPPPETGFHGPTTISFGIGRSIASIKGLALTHAAESHSAATPDGPVPTIQAGRGVDLTGVAPPATGPARPAIGGAPMSVPTRLLTGGPAGIRTVAVRGPVPRESVPLYLFAMAVTAVGVISAVAFRLVGVGRS